MAKITAAGLLHGQPVAFATNSLEIVVEKGNPLHIDSLAQLATRGLLFVTCPIEVPIGGYTAEVLRNAGVTVTPASLEENVKGILTKVALGEADAGIVYRTDILAAGSSVAGVPIADNVNLTTKYLVGALRDSQNQDASQRFISFLSSEQGQKYFLNSDSAQHDSATFTSIITTVANARLSRRQCCLFCLTFRWIDMARSLEQSH